MNRKTIEKLSQRSDYNKELFANAMSVVQNCQQLISKTEGLSANEKASLKDKQQQLEAAFKNAIGLMGIFANVQKAPLATLVDHSVEIFEAITDNI